MVERLDKRSDMVVAAELMLRQFFGRKSADSSVKQAQDEITRQILKFIGGDDAERDFVRSEISLHSDKGVSPIWLSSEFTLPLFALAAEDLCDLLSPSGKGFIRCDVAADEDAFFGLKLVSVTSEELSETRNHEFDLYALAGTKRYLDSAAGMRSVHDLVAKRLAALNTKPW
uniref:Uncharacterized protein n=2 Tax=Rhizobium/Agrobacterium group TaxID=227290 RepID=A0AAW9FQW7_9HYPH|nr:hypothetical protein [Agrobacterium rosae]MDX8305193.1 hypothetical protein [Agrobacterium rosae]MDX8316291.1 hypothetical protein [Agrobacterium rosae]MDX8321730.1 hypothetical protein [Agrobacterium sp. rho-8.1]MDX8332402.1 hypothetical protein [Agrobacterium rosae]